MVPPNTPPERPPADDALTALITVRDWLRYAVSRFAAAKLAYGHGTSNAQDEAAFLILSVLDLPIDDLEPWLDARLTAPERQKIHDIIEARIATRKPASYLTNTAWIGPHKFYVDERTIVPRSYIGELIGAGLEDAVPPIMPGGRILDLCTGSGCLAIILALTFPQAHVDAADISSSALAVANRNVDDYGLSDRISLIYSDVFSGLGGKRYDLIISNPPYVTARAVSAFPPEYRAEPVLAHIGGDSGLDIVLRILDTAAGHLTTGGMLIMEIGNGRAALEAARPDLPFIWFDAQEAADQVCGVMAADLLPAAQGQKKSGRKTRRI